MKNYTIEKGKVWRIGDVIIKEIFEAEMVIPFEGNIDMAGASGFNIQEVLPDLRFDKQELQWLIPQFATENFNMREAMHSFLIQSNGKNILVETGMNAPTTTFGDNLKAAGCEPEDIDYVMYTHLHFDHIARNCKLSTFGSIVPMFPNARYLFSKEQYDFLKELQDDPSKRRNIPEYDHIWPFRLQLLPLVEQGRVDFIDEHFTLHDTISLYPTPGHMKGEVSIVIKSKGDSAFIAGDFVQFPVQMTQLDVSSSWDYDPEASKETRRKVFAELAGTDTLFLAMHFLTGGFVVKNDAGDGYKLLTDNA